MLDVLTKKESASFAFIGMPLENEVLQKTKRFTVYELYCRRYFSHTTFDHFYDESNSFYMLLNKKNNTEKIYNQILEIAQTELQEEMCGGPNLGRSTG